MNQNQSKHKLKINNKKSSPEVPTQVTEETDVLIPGSLTIIDGNVPTGNVIIKAVDQIGKEFLFEGESSGKFTLDKEIKLFGSCEFEMEPNEEVKLPSSNAPVTLQYNYINITSLDPNFTKMEF